VPLYDYRCEAGHTTEQLQRYPTGAIRCPVCGKDAERQVSKPSVPKSGTYSYQEGKGEAA